MAQLIKYFLAKNKLSSQDSIPYIPRTIANGSISGEALLSALSFGSSMTKADCLAVLENLNRILVENLSQGRSVNLGFLNLKPSVKGSFFTPDEPFNKEKHSIHISVAATGSLIKKVNLSANPARVSAVKKRPQIDYWINQFSEGKQTIRSGEMIEMRGDKLVFEKTDLAQGVFIKKENEEKIRVNDYSRISSRVVIFRVPEGLSSGEKVTLSLKAKFGSDIRSGEFESEIAID